MSFVDRIARRLLCAAAASAWSLSAMAQTPAAATTGPKVDSGDTAWMLTSTALVLMMTIPGVALFYGGMVRKKNVLATSDHHRRCPVARESRKRGAGLPQLPKS